MSLLDRISIDLSRASGSDANASESLLIISYKYSLSYITAHCVCVCQKTDKSIGDFKVTLCKMSLGFRSNIDLVGSK